MIHRIKLLCTILGMFVVAAISIEAVWAVPFLYASTTSPISASCTTEALAGYDRIYLMISFQEANGDSLSIGNGVSVKALNTNEQVVFDAPFNASNLEMNPNVKRVFCFPIDNETILDIPD